MSRQSFAALFPARITGPPDWPVGPLPLRWQEVQATAAARGSYFSAACARILYGTAEGPRRWHCHISAGEGAPTGDGGGIIPRSDLLPAGADYGIFGVEIVLPFPERLDQAFAIFHVRVSISGIGSLDLLRAVAGRRASQINPPDFAGLLPAWACLTPAARAFTVAFTTLPGDEYLNGEFPDGQVPLPVGATRTGSWSAADTWLWHLASRTAGVDYPPDPEHADRLLAGRVVLSADWRGLITRDGAAFLGLRPDVGPADPFFGFAQLYTHTTYVDALVIGMVQHGSITQMIDDAARAFDADDLPRHLAALEERTARFRSIYWLRDASSHGPANDILTAYQEQHRLPERFEAVLGEIVDLNRIAQAQEGQYVSAALGVLTVVGLPFGAAFAVLQVLGDGSPADLAIAMAAALAGSGALLRTRFGRLLLRSLRTPG
ncbi:conserved hypothetical protein [Frankia sp. AiPs1]|uniref:hypothetical protein n=1 Tax=Frankia sp. AiPa1 TaxID=573492 RepID=UPI00202ACA87|nr:hypothetical protein [Frankia sp. AiPa1]MCL9761300.1 hypothetical protein [Frankia sp. AiPa1]